MKNFTPNLGSTTINVTQLLLGEKEGMNVDSYKITDCSCKNAEEFLGHQNNDNKSRKLILCFVFLY